MALNSANRHRLSVEPEPEALGARPPLQAELIWYQSLFRSGFGVVEDTKNVFARPTTYVNDARISRSACGKLQGVKGGKGIESDRAKECN